MTDVVFVTSNHQLSLSHEPNGTMILATLLRQEGISTKILRFAQMENYNICYAAFISEITERILSMQPRCVSFYTLWPFYHIMLRIARELKQRRPELLIVLGGPQASATAEATMKAAPYVDYICTGEGEQTVIPFFRALLDGDFDSLFDIPGLYRRHNRELCINHDLMPLCDLNKIPYWDEALFKDDYTEDPDKLSSPNYFMPIDVGRGCPYRCTFCCSSRFWRRAYRLKSADRLIADIKYYKERFGIVSFRFSHDAFTSNMRRVEELCDRLIAENLQIRWCTTSRVDRLSESLIRKMKQAGMVRIELGVETGSQDMQKRINKNLDLSYVQRMVDILLSEKINVALYFMYGFPEETEEDLAQTVSMQLNLLDAGLSDTSMSFCKFNPTTIITEKYFDELKLDPSCKIITRGLSFGYEEEYPVIAANKAIFPFFYHLSTPVRDNYQYLYFFFAVYRRYRNVGRYLRQLYGGDDLRLYKDFCEANKDIFDREISYIEKQVFKNMQEMVKKFLDNCNYSCQEQLRGLLQYDHDMHRISSSECDVELEKIYSFVYVEILMRIPAEELSKGTSRLILKKQNGKVSKKLLEMK